MTTLTHQNLIDTGDAWRLEGSVGRSCMEAIESGFAVLGPRAHRDYWGNVVPGRHNVVEGTKGSVTYALARIAELEEILGADEVEDLIAARDRILALECPECLARYDDLAESCDTCQPVKEGEVL